MSFFQGQYLRILTPRTFDGVNLKMVDNQPVYKESHLPVTARKHMVELNSKLPPHLRHIIEDVGFTDVEAAQNPSTPKPTKPSPKPSPKPSTIK